MYSLIIDYPDDVVAEVGASYLLKEGMLECDGRYPIRKEDFIFLWHALASRSVCGSAGGFIFTDISCVSLEDLKDLVWYFNAVRYKEGAQLHSHFVNPKRQLLAEHKLYTSSGISPDVQAVKTILRVKDTEDLSAYDKILEPVCFSSDTMFSMYAALKKMTRICLWNGEITQWQEDHVEEITSYLGDSKDSVDSDKEGVVTTYICGMQDACKNGDCVYDQSNTCELKNTRGTEHLSVTGIANYSLSIVARKWSYWLYDRVVSGKGKNWTKHTDEGGYCQRVEKIYNDLTLTFDCEKLNGLDATLYAAVEVRIHDSRIHSAGELEKRHYVVCLGEHTIRDGKISLEGNYLSSFVSSLNLATSKSILGSVEYQTLEDLPETLFVGNGDAAPVESEGSRESSASYSVEVVSGEPYAIVDVEEDKYFDVRWE